MKYFLIITILSNSISFLASDNKPTPQTIAKKYNEFCPPTNPTKTDSQGIITQQREAELRDELEQQRIASYQRYRTLPPKLPFEDQ